MNLTEQLEQIIRRIESAQSAIAQANCYRGTNRFTRQLAIRSSLTVVRRDLAAAAADLESDMRSFSREAITVAEFLRRVASAHSELEVRRLVLYHQEKLMGSQEEVEEAMNFANQRALELSESGVAIGALGGRAADLQPA